MFNSKPIYQHESDPNLFLSYNKVTKEWRITSKSSIGGQKSFCNFKETNGILHDPSKFSLSTTRKCYVKESWVDTDLVIIEAPKSGLEVRHRTCADFDGQGSLRVVVQGTDWQFDFNSDFSGQNTRAFANFGHSFADIISVDTVTSTSEVLCLSELTVATPTNAVNLLLTKHKSEIKISKKSGNWPVAWWDGKSFGTQQENFQQQFIMPKSVESIQPRTTGLLGKQVHGLIE